MPLRFKEIVLKVPRIRSLVWDGDQLIDWVGGGKRIFLDGSVEDSFANYAYRFDSAIRSASGRFVVLYEKLGTKALLLDRGKIVRELNRSYYQAHIYEYPIAFAALPDGTELLIHCPQEYCQLDIFVAETGECLTDKVERNPTDIFYSRLMASPGGTWFASAGWVWHPFSIGQYWSILDVLKDPGLLDRGRSPKFEDEVESLTFLDDRFLIGAENREVDTGNSVGSRLRVIDAESGETTLESALEIPCGTLIPFSEGRVLSLYRFPRLLRIADGETLLEWPHLETGMQASSIIHHLETIPPFAKHLKRTLFAVAESDQVTVVEVFED